jgi:hypothetical protein
MYHPMMQEQLLPVLVETRLSKFGISKVPKLPVGPPSVAIREMSTL